MKSDRHIESRRCHHCGAEFAPVQPSQRFCSGTNHRYQDHARIRPRGRRRDTVGIMDRVEVDVVHVAGAISR